MEEGCDEAGKLLLQMAVRILPRVYDLLAFHASIIQAEALLVYVLVTPSRLPGGGSALSGPGRPSPEASAKRGAPDTPPPNRTGS